MQAVIDFLEPLVPAGFDVGAKKKKKQNVMLGALLLAAIARLFFGK